MDINKKNELKTMISKKLAKNQKKKNQIAKNNINNNHQKFNDEIQSLRNKESNDKNTYVNIESEINIKVNGDKEIVNSKAAKKNKNNNNNDKENKTQIEIQNEKELNKNINGILEENITFVIFFNFLNQ